MDRMLEYNNAGVSLVDRGLVADAHAMFREALRCKLASDSAHLADCEGFPVERCVTPEMDISASGDTDQVMGEEGQDNTSQIVHRSGVLPSSSPGPCADRVPGLSRLAFSMTGDEDVATASAIVVFNMAMTHQVQDAKSAKAGQFYQIAAVMTTLKGGQPSRLHQAIMSNLIVWSAQNSCAT